VRTADEVTRCAALLLEAVSEKEKDAAEKKLEKEFRAWFLWQGREVLKRLTSIEKFFVEASIDTALDSLIDAALEVTVGKGETFLASGAIDGYRWGYDDLNESLDLQAAFDLPHPEAVKWADKNAAKNIAGVNNTTKKHIKNLVVNGLEEGESYSSVARAIKNQFKQFAVGSPLGHIESRAELIAVTEMGNAYEAGGAQLIGELKDVGLKMEKSRGGPNDGVTSNACLGDLADGWIPEDQAFSSGIMDGLEHPGCRHHTQYRVERSDEEKAEELRAQASVAKERVSAAENTIRNDTTETGIAFNNRGEVVLEKKGLVDRVNYTENEINRMRGSTLTHNHPANVGFSEEDLHFLIQNGLQEIRAVTPTKTFSMKIPDAGFKYGSSKLTPAQQISEARAAIRFEAKAVKHRVKKQIRNGEITAADANANAWNEISSKVAKRLNLEYEVVNL